jgi:hypothetical protein
VFPKSGQATGALTASPKDAKHHKRHTQHLADALHCYSVAMPKALDLEGSLQIRRPDSIAFAVSAMNVLAVVLSHILR